jgi:hypothetical protein
VLAQNDDHASTNLTLDIFDAQIVYDAPDDAPLTIELREFLGRAGLIELVIVYAAP